MRMYVPQVTLHHRTRGQRTCSVCVQHGHERKKREMIGLAGRHSSIIIIEEIECTMHFGVGVSWMTPVVKRERDHD